MTSPTPQQISAATAALRADAASWARAAAQMSAAGAAGARLDLSALHFSYLGDKVGLTDAYQALQSRLVRLCGEAAQTFDQLAASLRKAADGYDDDEAHAVHRMRGIY
jgi:hypothetical protein